MLSRPPRRTVKYDCGGLRRKPCQAGVFTASLRKLVRNAGVEDLSKNNRKSTGPKAVSPLEQSPSGKTSNQEVEAGKPAAPGKAAAEQEMFHVKHCPGFYLPMQKVLKTWSRISSLLISPVIRPRPSIAFLKS